MTTNHLKLLEFFISWMEKNINNGELSINQPDSFLHVVNEGFLVLPVVLTHFLNNYADSSHINNKESLKSLILSSIFSLTTSNSLLWKYDVIGNRLYSCFELEGLLIKDIGSNLKLKKAIPMSNKYLFIEMG